MNDLLNKHQLHFPARHDPSTTLQHFLNNIQTKPDQKTRLPMIVRVTSLNNYGRINKSPLTKMTPLLLINIDQLDSILAEYHDVNENRNHSNRNRFKFNQNRISNRTSTRFRNMKKLSRSLVSLTGSSTTDAPHDNDEDDEDEDFIDENNEFTTYQRNLVKSLNEKLLSSTSSFYLCRIPLRSRLYFELLNESDDAIKPYSRLSDLMVVEYEDQYPEKLTQRWPNAFLLRSSSAAFTRYDDQSSATTSSSDSCYGSSVDLDTQKNVIVRLNDEPMMIPAGQILAILGECQGLRKRTTDKNSPEPFTPSPRPSSAGVSGSPSSSPWAKGRGFFGFFKKSRPSQILDLLTSEPQNFPTTTTTGNVESYLKCRTEQSDIVYFSLRQSGLFSPLNGQTHRLKLDTKCNDLNLSGLFQLNDLLMNFRFPISVRCLDSQVSFDNIYTPAVIHRTDSVNTIATKFRLRMQYREQVVFVCPLHLSSSKSLKSSTSLTVIPISTNADILIQPCLNMEEIGSSEAFDRLLKSCYQIVNQYQTEISLIHFPLQIHCQTVRNKQTLYKKRSQSESQLGYVDEDLRQTKRHSDDNLNDHSRVFRASPLDYASISPNHAVIGTNQTRVQHSSNRNGHYNRRNDFSRFGFYHSDSEDENYRDVDKIYDFIRSGHVTNEVKKIQDKELATHKAQAIDIPLSDGSPQINVRFSKLNLFRSIFFVV